MAEEQPRHVFWEEYLDVRVARDEALARAEAAERGAEIQKEALQAEVRAFKRVAGREKRLRESLEAVAREALAAIHPQEGKSDR